MKYGKRYKTKKERQTAFTEFCKRGCSCCFLNKPWLPRGKSCYSNWLQAEEADGDKYYIRFGRRDQSMTSINTGAGLVRTPTDVEYVVSKNEDIYRSAHARSKAHAEFCGKHGGNCGTCPAYDPTNRIRCMFRWLELTADTGRQQSEASSDENNDSNSGIRK